MISVSFILLDGTWKDPVKAELLISEEGYNKRLSAAKNATQMCWQDFTGTQLKWPWENRKQLTQLAGIFLFLFLFLIQRWDRLRMHWGWWGEEHCLNCEVRKNQLGTLLKCDSDSMSPGKSLTFCISHKLWVMLNLLVLKSHFEDKEYAIWSRIHS